MCDVQAYETLYQRLISRIGLVDVSASFVMEELKDTTELPLPWSSPKRHRSNAAICP
tara:strand:+ start:795 stop:965 length:171 start_codon:yes stop_codon:yes gene_type:complete